LAQAKSFGSQTHRSLPPLHAETVHTAQVSPGKPLPLLLLPLWLLVTVPLDELLEELEELAELLLLEPWLVVLLPLEPPPPPPGPPPPGTVQTLERQTKPVLHSTLLQQGCPSAPHSGGPEEEQAQSARAKQADVQIGGCRIEASAAEVRSAPGAGGRQDSRIRHDQSLTQMLDWNGCPERFTWPLSTGRQT
jgi:hypothetical protein